MDDQKKYIAKYRGQIKGFGDSSKEAARHHVVDYTRCCRGEVIDVDVYEAIPIKPARLLAGHVARDICSGTRELHIFGSDLPRANDNDIDLGVLFDQAAALAMNHIKQGLSAHYGVEAMAYEEGAYVRSFDSKDFEGDE